MAAPIGAWGKERARLSGLDPSAMVAWSAVRGDEPGASEDVAGEDNPLGTHPLGHHNPTIQSLCPDRHHFTSLSVVGHESGQATVVVALDACDDLCVRQILDIIPPLTVRDPCPHVADRLCVICG